MPVMRRVAEAGYRFVPHARGDGFWIERFGDKPGKMFLTVWNGSKRRKRGDVTIDLAALGLTERAKELTVRQLHPDREIAVRRSRNGRRLTCALSVGAERTVVLEVR